MFYLRYYLDPDTNERLTTWRNPLNNATVTVVHVSNDPVNNPVSGPFPLVDVGGSTQVRRSGDLPRLARVKLTRSAGAASGRAADIPEPSAW